MPLTVIDLCGLYNSRQSEQTLAVKRIVAHYDIRGLEYRGVAIAKAKCVLIFPLTRPQIL
jgi:hypothetical protein